MKIINQLIILILIIPFNTWCQSDTTYYFGVNGRICDVKKPEVKKDIAYISDGTIRIETSNFKDEKWILVSSEKMKIVDENEYNIHIKGALFSGRVVRTFEKLENNKYKFTDRIKRRVIRTGETSTRIPLIFNGEVIEYYKNGIKKSVSIYKDNRLVSNKNWLKSGDPYIDDVFYSVDKEPFYRMGISIIHANLRNAFINSSIDISQLNGRIIVGFIVMEDGSIDGIRIEEGLNQKLNEVALNAFLKFRVGWQPAQLNGNDVRYYQLFPINFINKEKKFEFTKLNGREINFGN
ncbi:MAG TPA: energy transducer TonB [Prolixibacteraceae bacterium]|nr:energy transducer TonB [Prolixibacteraceae bacterium]